MPRISARTFGLFGLGTGVVLFTILVAFAPSDSPVEVCGGSIYIRAYNSNTDTYGSFCDKKMPLKYCATTDDSTRIDFTEFTGGNVLVVGTGWKIHLFNKSGKDSSKPEAMVVCSAYNCAVKQDELSPGDKVSVYVEPTYDPNATPPLSEWVPDPNGNKNEPHFHDIAHAKDGAPRGKEDKDVDHIEFITIEANGQDSTKQYPCPLRANDGNHVCKIYVGTRGRGRYFSNLVSHRFR